MNGPAPAVARVRLAVRSALATVAGAPLLVACSGGPDSVALAAAVAFETSRTQTSAGAVVIDHGLQEHSDVVARDAGALLYELGLEPVHVVRVAVGGQGGPEAAARTARYAALDRVAGADAVVLLGHTRDDQAETVLLGLGRGSGPRSIAGMRRRDGRYLRPLLDVSRATTQAACAALDLPVWRDPHNDDPRFRRVRLRTEALPLLEDILAGGVAAALARTADQVRADLDALDVLADAALADAAQNDPLGDLVVDVFANLPAALRTRVIRLWATHAGAGPLGSVHIDALDRLVTNWHGQGPIDLPGGVCAARRSGRLHLYRPAAAAN